SVAAPEAPVELPGPAEALLLFRAPGRFGDVGADLVDVVVCDRDRDQIHVISSLPGEGFDHPRQEPVPGRSELPGTGATALHVPLEGEATLHEVVDVRGEDELVEVVA